MLKSWRERIAEARERGGFTHEDLERAHNWCTCAVSEQPHILELYQELGSPAERTAFLHLRLPTIAGPGSDFYGAVNDNDFDRAERLLETIEDEAFRLKREPTP